MIKSKITISIIILSAAIIFGSWGDKGHSMISFRMNLSFNEEMSVFNNWIFYLSEHASDADWRKKDDPEEGPKHYIDIDNYEVFAEEGAIPHSLDVCIEDYGAQFVDDNGYLPWATLAMYDSVVNCLEREDWTSAKKYAADLGHYVADGHMPMHLTRNYDGQFTGNKGIHARYEIYMIERYHDQVNYQGTPAEEISDVTSYVFDYIYRNYTYMDSILIADDYATEMAEGNESDLYYAALWERTENMTIAMFSEASHALAELLYTAWIEAGKPGEETTDAVESRIDPGFELSVRPNPVTSRAMISYTNPAHGDLLLTIYDHAGRKTWEKKSSQAQPGHNSIPWNPGDTGNGAYYLVLQSGRQSEVTPFLVIQ